MNAVGIDVSKGKSMMAALRPMGEIALRPKEYPHTEVGLERMSLDILALGEDTRALMEATGRYHEPVAAALHEYGIRVTVINPLFIKQSGGGSIRKVKTDKADAKKIAKYGLDNWMDLREYAPVEAIREQLKLVSRQFNLYMKNVVALQNNLISLTDKVFPGVNEVFSSKDRADGSQKWVDFIMTFWHCECIALVSEAVFTERYRKWCKRNRYNFSSDKAAEIYTGAKDQIAMIPKDDLTKRLIRQTIDSLNTVSKTVEQLKSEMLKLASQLPEFPAVMEMHGVGDSLGPQLMAEIGDVTRFIHRSSITAFAGVDPGANQSGEREAKSVRTSKSGPPELRRTLFLVMDGLLKSMPQDDPVYQFMDKKRAEGKPYLVYMTAGANKFLRIYYGRVKEYLASLETAD